MTQTISEGLLSVMKECDIEVRSYSGKFMFGSSCVGVISHGIQWQGALVKHIAATGQFHLLEEYGEFMEGMLTDNMAMDYVYYNPSFSMPEVEMNMQ
jgi:hypothetical protein